MPHIATNRHACFLFKPIDSIRISGKTKAAFAKSSEEKTRWSSRLWGCIALFFLLLVASFCLPAQSQTVWKKADYETRRLPPAAFQQLPLALRRDLEQRGCTITQEHFEERPHNVIQGQFARPGQNDWAVLCSIERVPIILVYWGGSPDNPAELAKGEDMYSLQGLDHIPAGEEIIGYSRKITPASAETITGYYEAFGGPEPPPLDHQGIGDAFVGKASVVHYFYQGKWLVLTGAD